MEWITLTSFRKAPGKCLEYTSPWTSTVQQENASFVYVLALVWELENADHDHTLQPQPGTGRMSQLPNLADLCQGMEDSQLLVFAYHIQRVENTATTHTFRTQKVP